SPRPELAVEGAVINRFREMLRANCLGAFQVGHGPGHAQNAVVGTCRQSQFIHRRTEKSAPLLIQRAILPQLPTGHAPIEAMTIRAEALSLRQSCSLYLFAHSGAGGPIGGGCQFLKGYRRNLDVEINPVQEWPADLADVFLNLAGVAFA